jgi:hypothetical protein
MIGVGFAAATASVEIRTSANRMNGPVQLPADQVHPGTRQPALPAEVAAAAWFIGLVCPCQTLAS